MALLEPKEITVKTLSGEERVYIISKFPALAGREIITSYPLTALPKVATYSANETVMLKLMGYVAVDIKDNRLQLSTKALVDNHVPDWETLVKIELAMMEYNTSFFNKGEISTFFGGISRKAIASISPTLTHLLQPLLAAVKQAYKN